MAACYLIGIGGTGSRCIQAFIHLAAAGLGPEQVDVAMVDQDISNGNLYTTTQLLDRYKRLFASLHDIDGESAFLKTKITSLDNPVWSPLPENQASLKQNFEYNALRNESKLVFDALFSKRFERDQLLNEGFRGRPAVGAAAIHSAADHDYHWRRTLEALKETMGDDIRIVIIGSIFGGTGAAGLPTLARILRRAANDLNVQLQLSAILMLPYFQYHDPRESELTINVPKSRAFALNTQHALRYYHQFISQLGRDVFDYFYLIGFSPLFDVPYREAGGKVQENEPLFPELVSALAVLDAFSKRATADNSLTQIFRMGFENDNIEWQDLKHLALTDNESIRNSLGQLLRFALAYTAAFRPSLMPGNHRKFSKQIWYKRLIQGAAVDLSDQHIQSLLRDLENYCESFMLWSFYMSRDLGGNFPKFRLFSLNPLIDTSPEGHKLNTEQFSKLGKDFKKTFKLAVESGEGSGMDQVFLEHLPGASRR